MRIYLDNNATTAIHPDVLAVLDRSLREIYGNASSVHREGQAARRCVEEARETVARLIGATAREIVFTSGGTESNNAAVFGACPRGGRFHIVTTAIEHPSVAEAVRELGREGAEVSFVPALPTGIVPAEAVAEALRADTKLVAVMLANNETGVIQPVEEIGRLCRERGIHFHCDAVQAVGRIAVDVETIGCDTLSLSGHKIHAPKGIGALYVRRGVTMKPLMAGGAQERRRRAGTEPVPLVAALGAAAALPSAAATVGALRDRFEESLRSRFDVTINGAAAPRVPNTSNVTFRRNGAPADAEGIVIALDLAGIAASTGSACSSGRVEPSSVLLAMGLSPAEARATVRFSLSRFTTEEEIDLALEAIARALA